MISDYLNLLAIINSIGVFKGRTRLQKIIYILKCLEFDFDENFQFSHYGPFSQEVDNKIEEMKNLGFISEDKIRKGLRSYFQYEIKEFGKKILDDAIPEDISDLEKKVKEFYQLDTEKLELIASILFLKSRGYGEIEIKEKLVVLKPHFRIEQIEIFFHRVEKGLGKKNKRKK